MLVLYVLCNSVIVLPLFFGAIYAVDNSWYIGCYPQVLTVPKDTTLPGDTPPLSDDSTPLELAEPGITSTPSELPASHHVTSLDMTDNDGTGEWDPVTCSRQCLTLRWGYASVDAQRGCVCLRESPSIIQHDSSSHCNASCDMTSAGQVPCGGEGWTSIYRTDGPYLISLNVTHNSAVYEHQKLTIEVRAHFAGLFNMSLGSGLPEVDTSSVLVTWSTASANSSVSVVTASRTVRSVWLASFSQTGPHVIDVHVTNGLSSLSAQVLVEVLALSPSSPDLELVVPSPQHQPSCSHEIRHLELNTTPVSLAFVGDEVELRASLARGFNITFVWDVYRNRSETRSELVSHTEGRCPQLGCHAHKQKQTFVEAGAYQVTVDFISPRGTAHAHLLVLVEERQLANLVIALSTNQTTVNTAVMVTVAMTTNNPHGHDLELDFGDGSAGKRYPLQSSATRVVGYGDDCNLTIVTNHSYQEEGAYDVSGRVVSGDGQAKLDAEAVHIDVQRQMVGLNLHLPPAAASNIPFNLSASLNTSSDFATYRWRVICTSDHEDVMTADTLTPWYTIEEMRPGLKQVHVSVENLVSRLEASDSFLVEEPVGQLTLRLNRSSHVLELGQVITLLANVTGGSNMAFHWELGDDAIADEQIVNHLLSSSVTHTFSRPGVYNISVTASNSYNRNTIQLRPPLVVQEAISGLIIASIGTVQLDQLFNVRAYVTTGSHVLFDLDFGDGSTQKSIPGGNINETHKFVGLLGSRNITVTAFNNVSNVTEHLEVVLQAAVKGIRLASYPVTPVQGDHTVLAAHDDNGPGKLQTQQDVVYTWSVNKQVLNHTAVPVVDHVFQEAGTYNLTLQVFNMVSNRTTGLQLTVESRSQSLRPRFNQSCATGVHKQTTIQLLLLASTRSVLMRYQEGGTFNCIAVQSPGLVVGHQYNDTGLHHISAACYNETDCHPTSQWDPPVNVTSVITAQVSVSCLHIDGPSAIALHRISNHRVWTAYPCFGSDPGSDVVYNWTLSNEPSTPQISTSNTFVAQLLQEGLHTITLHAFNSISGTNATKRVLIQQALLDVVARADPTLTPLLTFITLNITGGSPILININYGDGNHASFWSNQTLPFVDVVAFTDKQFCFVISHNYTNVGLFGININTSNQVSSKKVTLTAVVEEPITGLVLTNSTPYILRTDEVAMIKASVATGNNLKFDWAIADYVHTSVNNSDRASVVNIRFQEPGNYTVRVSVYNPIYTQLERSVSGELEGPISVYWPLTGVTVSSLPSQYAPLVIGNSTGNVSFTAVAIGGTNVMFTFTIGEQATPAIPGCQDDLTNYQATVLHQFQRPGEYSVTVEASTPVDRVTATHVFYVEVAPAGLTFLDLRPLIVYRSLTTFRVSLSHGTHVQFDWNFGDGSVLRSNAGQVVNHTYTKVGSFTVVVTASNKVSSQSQTAPVTVQAPIRGVSVTPFPRTPHKFKTQVALLAEVEDCMQGNVDWYQFDFGDDQCSDEPIQSNVSFCIYSKPARYSVRVTAINQLGNMTSEPVEVICVQPFSEVTIDVYSDRVVGQELSLKAYHFFGTEMTYQWDFGDGSSSISTRQRTVKHTYTREDRFQIGLNASNAFNWTFVTKELFVLRKPCKAPEVTMLGEPHQVFTRSSEVKIEAEVNIDCSITSATVYEWRIYNKTGVGDERAVLGLHAQLLHDPMLLLPRLTLHYGSYVVQLMVNMTGTIVSTKERSEFDIVPSEVKAIIQGGFMRKASRSEMIVMDATLSHDPDFPYHDSLRYKWKCYSLILPEEPCFSESWSDLDLNDTSPTLNIPGRIFNTSLVEFVFNLTVFRQQQQQQSGWVTQVVALETGYIMDVNIQCDQCELDLINGDHRVLLLATLPHHANLDEMIFSWTLYEVRDGSEAMLADIHNHCVLADGTTYNMVLTNVTGPPTSTGSTTSPSSTTGSTTSPSSTTGSTTSPSSATGSTTSPSSTTGSTTSPSSTTGSTTSPSSTTGSTTSSSTTGSTTSPSSTTGSTTSPSSTTGSTTSPSSTTGSTTSPSSTTGSSTSSSTTGLTTSPCLTTKSTTSPSSTTGSTTSPSSTTGSTTSRSLSPSSTTTTTSPPFDPFGGGLDEGSSPGRVDLPLGGEQPSGGRGMFGDGFEEGGDLGGRPGIGGLPDLSEGPSDGRGDPGQNPGGSASGEEEDDGDTVVDDETTVRSAPHIVSLPRRELVLRAENTTTGLGRRVLGLKEGLLGQGLTYLVQLTVTHAGSRESGQALTYFRVNESPSLGRCSLHPDPQDPPGVEMETTYRVDCEGWQDKETPLRYELSYRLAERLPEEIIYRGLNHVVSFRLPAGLPDQRHQVQLRIAILDNLGARTTVCRIPVRIEPHDDTNNRTHEEILYALVESNHSDLAKYLDEGDNRNARLHTQMVASRLNRLPSRPSHAQAGYLRREIRQTMLGALSRMPLRDQYEIQQTASALTASTSVIEELNNVSLRFATDIITNTSRQINSIAMVTENLGNNELDDLAQIAMEGTSNILRAVGASAKAMERRDAKYIVHNAETAVQNVLQAELRKKVAGEGAVNKSTSTLTAYAHRYSADTPATVRSPAAVFVLPGRLTTAPSVVAGMADRGGDSATGNASLASPLDLSCYQMLLVTYKDNPFVYGLLQDTQIESQVATLTLHLCSGEELKVSNLTDDQLIDIFIPHQAKQMEEQPSYTNHSLDRAQMSVHQVNVSVNASARPLHVTLRFFTPPDNTRLFPTLLLLRFGEPPTPTEYQFKWDVPASQSEVNIHLPPQLHNESQQYYLGLVDARFNAGRRREGEAIQRNYTIKIWQGECVYWDEQQDMWSNHGCSMDAKLSSYDQAHCSCNHLTSFGARFSLAPNEIHLVSVDDFFSLKKNPVTVSFIGAILLLYLLLLYPSIRLDRHDASKAAPIHLIDNNPSDYQKYVITLETGFRKGASTTAKVSLVLHGEDGMSETRELISNARQPSLFQRNSRDIFFITLPQSLGRLQKAQIWHNNAGASPSWYLSRVIVQDMNRAVTYYFICEKWFAAEEEDGKVEREILVTDGGPGFKQVLWAKGAQYFADYHLWFSTLTRPSYSRFTRAQRLTCCLSLLMSYLAVNCVWYSNNETEYRGEFSLVDVSSRAVMVGIFTSLLVLPPNFLIIILFRRSKVSRVAKGEFCEVDHKTLKSESVSTMHSTTHLLQPANAPSIFDQSMHHWQSLQEWAQKIWAKRHPESDNSMSEGVKRSPVAQQQRVFMEESLEEPVRGQVDDTVVQTGDEAHKEEQDKPEEAVDGAGEDKEGGRDTEADGDKTGCGGEKVERRESGPGRGYVRRGRKPQHIKTGSNSSGHSSSSHDSHGSEGSMIQPPSRYTLIPPTPPSSIFNTPPRSPSSAHPGHGRVGVISRSQRGSEKSRSTLSGDFRDGACQGTSVNVAAPFHLPLGFLYVAWTLSVLLISSCAVVTILYGLSFGPSKSIQWLQSLFFSAVMCIFITHPFLIILYTLYTALRHRGDMNIFFPHDDSLLDNITEKSKTSELASEKNEDGEEIDMEKGIAARQRSRYLRFARPPQEKELITSRTLTLKQKKASALLNEVTLFVVQFILILIVALGNHDNRAYDLKSSITSSIIGSGSPSWMELTSVPAWWGWLNNQLLNHVDTDAWYTDTQPVWPWITIDNSLVLGQIHLRQHRIRQHKCNLPNVFSLPDQCRGRFSSSHRDVKSYGPNESFIHSPGNITRAATVSGSHGDYESDGFLVVLSNNMSEAGKQLRELEEWGWMDVFTRAVITEFTLYNPPSNLFTTVRMVLELPPTGGVFTSYQIVTATLYKYVSVGDNLVLTAELLFIIATMVKLHMESKEVISAGKDYFKNPWNFLEVCQCGLSIIFTACYIYRFLLVANNVETLRSTYTERFLDVGNVHLWDQTLSILVAWILFLITLQLLKALRHRQPFARFVTVYKNAAGDILVFAMVFVVWLAAYVSVTMALYGAVSQQFNTLDLSIVAMVGLLTGHYSQLRGMEEAGYWDALGWKLLITSFIIFVMGSLTAYIIAILNFHYKLFKDEALPMFTARETLSYYWEQLLYQLGFIAMATEDEDEMDHMLPPEYTMAEIEYQVEEMLFKMNSLAGTCNLPAKPPAYYSDSDTTFGGAAEDVSSGGSEHQPFNEEKFEHRVHKIEGNLFTREPQLAQLLQLESCGGEALAEQTEKQLRSHLELEIFRQLQLQRQDNVKVGGYPSGASSDMYASSLSTSHTLPSGGSMAYHGSTSSGTTSSSQPSEAHGSPDLSPGSKMLYSQPIGHGEVKVTKSLPQTPHKEDPLEYCEVLLPPISESSQVINKPPTPHACINAAEALVLQNVSDSTCPSSSSGDYGIPLAEIHKVKKAVEKSNSSLPSSTDPIVKMKVPSNAVHSDPNGTGAKSKKELLYPSYMCPPPNSPALQHVYKTRPVVTHTSTADVKACLSRVADTKRKQPSTDRCIGNNGSSDEQDVPPSSTQPSRMLRKTRSRGKGKGSGDGGDAFAAFDNRGYSSDNAESDRRTTVKRGRKLSRSHPREKVTRECW